MRISDWSSDVCSSDLDARLALRDDQVGTGDDEQRRADDGQAEAVEDRGKGHESLSGCGFGADLNVNGRWCKRMRMGPDRGRSLRPDERRRPFATICDIISLMRQGSGTNRARSE